jgi:hypothetical protein
VQIDLALIMKNALEQITKEAMRLPRQQKLALAGLLLELEDDCGDAAVDAAWEEEIRARIQAADSDKAVGIAYENVMREAQKRLAP